MLQVNLQKAFKLKPFKFPSGRIEHVQGYEPFCLRDLLKKGVPEKDICCGFMQVFAIPYTKSTGRPGNYFPDIFIRTRANIIEVKSAWTLKMDREIEGKIQGVRSKGLGMEIWVYSSLGNLIRKIIR